MSVNKKLELFRRVYCLSELDIKKAFEGDSNLDHVLRKYESCREKEGAYGNFKFLFDLDTDYANRFFDYIGFNALDLGDKR